MRVRLRLWYFMRNLRADGNRHDGCGLSMCRSWDRRNRIVSVPSRVIPPPPSSREPISSHMGENSILFIVALSMHSVMMYRHRSAGLHNRPISPQFGVESGFPTAAPIHTEKVQPSHNIAPHPQYASSHPTAVATPSPVQQQIYQPPSAPTPSAVAQPTPYYPQQQQGPIYQQPTDSTFGMGQVPALQTGSHEAQGQPIGHQQHYHPSMGPS